MAIEIIRGTSFGSGISDTVDAAPWIAPDTLTQLSQEERRRADGRRIRAEALDQVFTFALGSFEQPFPRVSHSIQTQEIGNIRINVSSEKPFEDDVIVYFGGPKNRIMLEIPASGEYRASRWSLKKRGLQNIELDGDIRQKLAGALVVK